MTTVRCPACAAAVPIGAPWCTLCFADLRPAPQPPPAVEATPEPAPEHELAYAGSATPPAAQHVGEHVGEPVLPPHPILDAPVHAPAPVAGQPVDEITWPCHSCGAAVAFELPACPACGAGFLADLSDEPPVLPGIGNLAHYSTGARLALMAGGAIGLLLVLLLVMLVLGHAV